MDEKKQIEEMTLVIAKLFCNPKGCYNCNLCDAYGSLELSCEEYLSYRRMASVLYAAGYRKQSGWISVDERLPESQKFVIVCDEYGNVDEAYFYHDRKFRWVDNEEIAFATHWMPLPERPKGE